MRYYFAPLDGITSAVYRRAHHRFFPGVDKYYAPFISPTQHHTMTPRELRDLLPEYNEGVPLVPQLLTKCAEDFLWAAGDLAAMGYGEVNLNLGCPSGTVVSKGKGSGALGRLEDLERFLDEIFLRTPIPISIKTRLGIRDPGEFHAILELYRRYPIAELTIHPRVQKEFYKGSVHSEYFALAAEGSPFPLCYNGDVNTPAEAHACQDRFPGVPALMLGRALVGDPALVSRIKTGTAPSREVLEQFHDEVFDGLTAAMNNRRNAMLHMKEIWFYHINLFDGHEKHIKRLRKATDTGEFSAAAHAIFRELPLRDELIPAWKKPSSL